MPKVDRTKHIFKTKPHKGFEYTDVAHTKSQALSMVKDYPNEYHAMVHNQKLILKMLMRSNIISIL